MRAGYALVAIVVGGLVGCGPGPGLPSSMYAGLPPQDTLAGGLAPAPSTATGGSAATPAAPGAPWWSGGMAMTGAPPSEASGGAGVSAQAAGARTAPANAPRPASAR